MKNLSLPFLALLLCVAAAAGCSTAETFRPRNTPPTVLSEGMDLEKFLKLLEDEGFSVFALPRGGFEAGDLMEPETTLRRGGSEDCFPPDAIRRTEDPGPKITQRVWLKDRAGFDFFSRLVNLSVTGNRDRIRYIAWDLEESVSGRINLLLLERHLREHPADIDATCRDYLRRYVLLGEVLKIQSRFTFYQSSDRGGAVALKPSELREIFSLDASGAAKEGAFGEIVLDRPLALAYLRGSLKTLEPGIPRRNTWREWWPEDRTREEILRELRNLKESVRMDPSRAVRNYHVGTEWTYLFRKDRLLTVLERAGRWIPSSDPPPRLIWTGLLSLHPRQVYDRITGRPVRPVAGPAPSSSNEEPVFLPLPAGSRFDFLMTMQAGGGDPHYTLCDPGDPFGIVAAANSAPFVSHYDVWLYFELPPGDLGLFQIDDDTYGPLPAGAPEEDRDLVHLKRLLAEVARADPEFPPAAEFEGWVGYRFRVPMDKVGDLFIATFPCQILQTD